MTEVTTMNEEELKNYQKKMMTGATGTMKLGVITGVGSYTMGAIGGNVPGAAPGLASANAALNLANVGNLAAVGMSLIPEQKSSAKNSSKKKGTPMNDPVSYF